MITVVRCSPCSVASRFAIRVRSGLVSIVAGESERSMNCRDGFGTMRRERLDVVDTRVVLHPLVELEDAVEHLRLPDPALGRRLDDDEDRRQLALTEVVADEIDRVPRLGRRCGSTSTVTPRIFIQPAGSSEQREHGERDPRSLATGRRITARDRRASPCRGAVQERQIRARRFQRSRWRCSSTSTTGSRSRPVTIAAAATIAIATATERITITGKRRQHAPSSARA